MPFSVCLVWSIKMQVSAARPTAVAPMAAARPTLGARRTSFQAQAPSIARPAFAKSLARVQKAQRAESGRVVVVRAADDKASPLCTLCLRLCALRRSAIASRPLLR